MRIILCVISVCLFLTANSQPKKTFEISGTIHSVDPILPLSVSAEKFLDGGTHSNSSVAFGLAGKYFITENLAVRLQAISTNRNIKDYRVLTNLNTTQVDDDRLTQHILKLAPGIQWSLIQKKLSFFAGFELPISFHGKTTVIQNYLIETSPGPVINTNMITTYDIPGGTSIGIGLFTGTNYFFTKKWAIGFELGSAFEKTMVGGIINSTAVNGAGILQIARQKEETIQQLKFSQLQAGIHLAYRIHE